jgi:hypothetical protein
MKDHPDETLTDLPIIGFVEFLDRNSPDDLHDLQEFYPGQSLPLDPRFVAGGDEIGIPLRLAVDACVKSMKTAVLLCDEFLLSVENRLAKAQRIASYGRIVSVIGSASIFVLVSQQYPTWTYVAAGSSFVGALLPEIAGIFSTGLNNNNLFANRENIINLRVSARLILGKLLLCKKSGYPAGSGAKKTEDVIEEGLILTSNIEREISLSGSRKNS